MKKAFVIVYALLTTHLAPASAAAPSLTYRELFDLSDIAYSSFVNIGHTNRERAPQSCYQLGVSSAFNKILYQKISAEGLGEKMIHLRAAYYVPIAGDLLILESICKASDWTEDYIALFNRTLDHAEQAYDAYWDALRKLR